jgi:hypothetical protein
VSNPRTQRAGDLEVSVVFEPTRIAQQVLELAYEILLPIHSQQIRSLTAPRVIDRSRITIEQAIYNKEDVA